MKLLDLSKIAALISLTVFMGFGSYLLWTTIQVEKHLDSETDIVLHHAESTLKKVDSVVDKSGKSIDQINKSVASFQLDVASVSDSINESLYLVNKPCVPAPCGVIANVNKTLGTFRGTAGTLEIAGNHWDKNLTTLDTQEATLFNDSHDVLTNLSAEIDEAHKTTLTLDQYINTPDFTAIPKNLNTITYNLGQTTTDFQTKFHTFLYPPPCKGVKCFFIHAYSYAKIASTFAEPAYWGEQILRDAKP